MIEAAVRSGNEAGICIVPQDRIKLIMEIIVLSRLVRLRIAGQYSLLQGKTGAKKAEGHLRPD